MSNLFSFLKWTKCSHPFGYLVVEKIHTIKPLDSEFDQVTYYFYCCRCRERMQNTFVHLPDGVSAFMKANSGERAMP